MKNCFPILIAAALGVVLGCNQGTPGGPGMKNPPPTTTSSAPSSTAPTTSTTTSSTTTSSSTDTTPSTETTASTPAATTEKPALGTDANPIAGDPENTFRLSTPTLATHLKQGEKKVVAIGISRAKNFDQDVTVKFTDVPKGVSIEPEEPVIKHGEKDVKVNVSAGDDAAVNDFTIKIIGHPDTGPDATNELKLTIDKP